MSNRLIIQIVNTQTMGMIKQLINLMASLLINQLTHKPANHDAILANNQTCKLHDLKPLNVFFLIHTMHASRMHYHLYSTTKFQHILRVRMYRPSLFQLLYCVCCQIATQDMEIRFTYESMPCVTTDPT